jgi:ferritin-like metal-binding protein YciE
MAEIETMDDLFMHFLKDVYYAERQVSKALPKMAKAAHSPELRQAFTHHREETQHHIERLQHVFEAINGILEEGEELLEEMKQPSPVRDAGLIACGQAIEHYEITRYGSLTAWAKLAGKKDVVSLLEETLAEEKKTDGLLNKLANEQINQLAKAA